MLLVNGQEVKVYNDIFQVELLDNRDEKQKIDIKSFLLQKKDN